MTYTELFQLCLVIIGVLDVIVSIVDLTLRNKKK